MRDWDMRYRDNLFVFVFCDRNVERKKLFFFAIVCMYVIIVVVVVVCAMTCRHAWGLRGDIDESVARDR